ncbi:hypothetical protein WJX74_004418 [Apatococcus lobatus]|uniref:Uncharacterized protein n=1 Tax=Apatococcus lobatus TaxID=904363 RepID=A0AAW1RID5_9CHLO
MRWACHPSMLLLAGLQARYCQILFQKSFRLDDLDLVTRARFNFKQNTGSLRTRVLGGVGSLNLTPTGHSIAWRKNLRTAVGSLALVATLQQPGGLQLPFGPPNRLPMQHHYGIDIACTARGHQNQFTCRRTCRLTPQLAAQATGWYKRPADLKMINDHSSGGDRERTRYILASGQPHIFGMKIYNASGGDAAIVIDASNQG